MLSQNWAVLSAKLLPASRSLSFLTSLILKSLSPYCTIFQHFKALYGLISNLFDISPVRASSSATATFLDT